MLGAIVWALFAICHGSSMALCFLSLLWLDTIAPPGQACQGTKRCGCLLDAICFIIRIYALQCPAMHLPVPDLVTHSANDWHASAAGIAKYIMAMAYLEAALIINPFNLRCYPAAVALVSAYAPVGYAEAVLPATSDCAAHACTAPGQGCHYSTVPSWCLSNGHLAHLHSDWPPGNR